MRRQLPRKGGGSSCGSLCPSSGLLSGGGAMGDQVGEQAKRSRHAGGQLPEKGQSCVDECALAVPRNEQGALARRLTRIVHRERRLVMVIPFAGEIEPALLHPALEVRRAEAVRRGE